MKQLLTSACILFVSYGAAAASSLPNYEDSQLCTNAYNKLWHTFDTVKSDLRGNPAAQTAIFQVEFPKILSQNFVLSINNLPIDANSDQVINITATGMTDVIHAAAFDITSWGQHHVAGPFSFKSIQSESTLTKKVYLMTTRDIDYTNNPNNQGCATYLAQKSMKCTIKKTGLHKKAELNSMNSYVVTTYVMPLENCKLWMSAPVEDFPTEN